MRFVEIPAIFNSDTTVVDIGAREDILLGGRKKLALKINNLPWNKPL